ncbi:uncharacterized protein LOC143559790 [Bidens hawaiensis]|uniref:uncharacterized protein LOC143559790 n=1 Tax=Bidens hawaiensis TaxID=980011 RepID=UPI00404B9E56
MEAQKFTMLNEIDVFKTSPSTLKVRVLRLWSIKDNKNVNEDCLMEMVLMDEDENRIQATVYKQDIFRFKRFLKESSTLTIVNPSVGLNGSNYRVIDCSNKLVLGPNTHVNPCQEFDGRMFGFKMILLVTWFMCSRAMLQTLRTKQAYNGDIGNCVYLTLWDHYASELSKYVIEHFDESQTIIVLQFGRVKYYTDSDGKGLLNGNDVSVRKPIPVKMLSSVDEEFLRATDFFNIGDICPIIFPKNIIILGTIKAICPDTEWYYIGCNPCSLKLMENNGEGGNEYECKTERCNVLGVLPTPRFKIKIRVQDSTGVVSLTLFDRDAKMLINKTSAELIDSQKQNKVENGGFPAELDCLLENKFAFKVDVAEFNFRNIVEDYGINKFTDDTNILTELQKRQNGCLQTDCNSVSLGAPMSEFQSPGSVSVKQLRDDLLVHYLPYLKRGRSSVNWDVYAVDRSRWTLMFKSFKSSIPGYAFVGEWSSLARYVNLQVNDYLVFLPVDQNTLRLVSQYSRNLYTSGNTSLPKGVMMIHGNVVATADVAMTAIPEIGTNDVYLAYLPLTHIFESVAEVTSSINFNSVHCTKEI